MCVCVSNYIKAKISYLMWFPLDRSEIVLQQIQIFLLIIYY